MTSGEHEPQQIVADVVVARRFEHVGDVRRDVRAERIEIEADLLALARVQRVLPQMIERAALRGRHQPCARIVRHAAARPVLERRDERVLRELFGHADVAHEPRDVRDDSRGLDPPDGIDRTVNGGVHHARPSASALGFASRI